MQGVAQAAVDRSTIQKILDSLPAYKKETFSAILTGGFRSAKHFAKIGLVDSSVCPFCSSEEKGLEHIFLTCPAWAYIRNKYPHVDIAQVRH